MVENESYMHVKNGSLANHYKLYITNVIYALFPDLRNINIQKDVDDIYIFEQKLENV